MPLIPQSIPALHGGVSQQAAVSRSPAQCEAATNCVFGLVKGVSKRPPLECLNEIASVDHTATFFHWARLPDGRWLLIAVPGDGSYAVYDAETGDQITTSNDTAQAYLMVPEGETAVENFFAVNIGDDTYIVNRSVSTALTADVVPGSLSGSAQTLQDSVLDGASEGAIYEILGDESNPVDTYYAKKTGGKWYEWVKPGVQYALDAATMPHIIDLALDEVDPLGATADFTPATWADREVGDEESNKAPAFVGYPISSLYFKSDRLGVLSRNGFAASKVGEYTDFWRSTVTDVLDDDRIDHKVAAQEVSDLYYAETVSKSLVLFANERQFSVDGEVFSPNHLSVNPITSYPTSPFVRPITIGSNVFFASDAGDSSSLREMFVQDDTVTMDAADVTAHVPEYLPANIRCVGGHPQLDHILLGSPDDPHALFSYQFKWQGDQKVLSAWNRWELQGEVIPLSLRAIGPFMYCVYVREDAGGHHTFIGRFNLKEGDYPDGMDHKVYLDHLQKVEPVYNEAEDRTYFSSTFPLFNSDGEAMRPILFRGGGFTNKATFYDILNEEYLPYEPVSDNQFYFYGDRRGEGDWYVGLIYESRFEFSEQFFIKDSRPQLHTRVNIRSMTIHFEETAYFRVDVKVRGHDLAQSEVVPALSTSYTARTVGDEYFRLNAPQLATGTYQFPILARASDATIELVNDSPLPSHFQAAEWKGLISTRTPR